MDRYSACRRASILGIVGNMFLMIIKGIVGFMTMSQAMIADFFNSLGDILSSLMTYIGNRVSSKAADNDHNLGHGKAEYIYSMLISIVMMYISVKVIIDSFNNNNFTYSNWLIVICLITIIVKLSLYIYVHRLYKKFNNILLDANSKDHRNDCFVTLITLISCIVSFFHISYIDSIVGIGISLWILYTSICLFRDSYNVLMDRTINDNVKDEILDIIKEYKEVKKIQHFNATPVGYQYQISFTIFVDGKLSTFKSHEIANKIEREIEKKVEEVYLTIIHVNPM